MISFNCPSSSVRWVSYLLDVIWMLKPGRLQQGTHVTQLVVQEEFEPTLSNFKPQTFILQVVLCTSGHNWSKMNLKVSQ